MSNRYQRMTYRKVGRSGLHLPPVSLGCWHNFGDPGTASHGISNVAEFHERARQIVITAFDCGITHIDLANNYGPPPGSAEERFGRILQELPRDELIISTKAGYYMWPGPYGDGGSRKYLISSCDQSLIRLGLEYVDIFYHHRPDPKTPLEETLGALDQLVRSGKALYVGVSNYSGAQLAEALRICERDGLTLPIIHQPRYSMFDRGIESDLLPVAEREGLGVICFSPLEQGLLTSKYLQGIPEDSRAAKGGFLQRDRVTPELQKKLSKLDGIARESGRSLAQLAISWVLRHDGITSALIGASRPEQVIELADALRAPPLDAEVLGRIDEALAGGH